MMSGYCEFSFLLPIYELLDEEDEVFGKELVEICNVIDIKIDMNFLMKKYDSYGMGLHRNGSGDILVFYNNRNSEIFITLDLYNGWTDQNNMIGLGIRCPMYLSLKVKEFLIELYHKGVPRSDFIESVGDKLKNEIVENNFPKAILDCNGTYNQRIEYYVEGVLKSIVG